MPRNPTTTKEISYTSKDFDSIKSDLVSYLKRYFPNTIQDFSDVSGGMAIVDLMAYLGDVLNFQIDRSVNESFLTRAVERKNIIALSKSLGYKPKLTTPASVKVNFEATFLNSTSASMTFTILPGTRLVSSFEPANFELVDKIDFSSEKNRTLINNDGTYSTYSISGATCSAGRTKTFSYKVPDNPKPFLSISLPDRLVTEIISVEDSNSNTYTEVSNLAQESIFYGADVTEENEDDIDYILKIKNVPFRYITEVGYDGLTFIKFGAGDNISATTEKIFNPEDFVLPNKVKGYADGFSAPDVDISSFLSTSSLGNLPAPGSILTIQYRVGGGIETNIGAGSLSKIINSNIIFYNPTADLDSPEEYNNILSSIIVSNPLAAYGGEDPESNQSIKENAIRNFSAQSRCVTLLDYKSRIFTMPSSYGRPFRVLSRKDPYKNSGIELVTICRDRDGYLRPCSDLLKNNIETYIKPFKGVSDSIRISDGNILNIGVNFSIYPSDGYNKDKALLDSMLLLQSALRTSNMDFGMNLSISSLVNLLQNQDYVAAVPFFRILNLTEQVGPRVYSSYSENVDNLIKKNIIRFKQDVIPELKYPNFDIQGSLA